MQKTIEIENNLAKEIIFSKKEKNEDIDEKIRELLNFQYSVIAKLDDVIKKISSINL
jgi:hypothetical protein